MNVITVLSDILTALGYTKYHGRDAENNLTTDAGSFPAVFIDEPVVTNGVIQKAAMVETHLVRIYFANKGGLDATPAQVQTIVQQERAKARRLLLKLQEATDPAKNVKWFRFDGGETYTITDVVTPMFDVGTYGCILELELKFNPTSSLCV